jgi:hypothetical protein
MSDLCRLIWCALTRLFRSRAALEAEILVLRHQLNVLRRKSPKRVGLSSIDRMLLVGLYRLAPGVVDALKIIRPETLIRWHRAGFRAYWRWKSRPRGGRPKTAADIRRLIREMSVANPLWGAPRRVCHVVGFGRADCRWMSLQAAMPAAARHASKASLRNRRFVADLMRWRQVLKVL